MKKILLLLLTLLTFTNSYMFIGITRAEPEKRDEAYAVRELINQNQNINLNNEALSELNYYIENWGKILISNTTLFFIFNVLKLKKYNTTFLYLLLRIIPKNKLFPYYKPAMNMFILQSFYIALSDLWTWTLLKVTN